MRAILLHNASAGNGDIAAEDLLAALARGGVSARYCSAKSPDFPDALREPADLVVLAGGDGTVIKAINHLRDRTVPIAILPLGSANNIARSLGIEIAAIEIARADWGRTETRRLDIGTASGPWGRRSFVEAIGVGVLAEAAAAIDEEDVRGAERSQRARAVLHEMLTEAEPQEMRFVIDGAEVEITFLLAEIMNTTSTGPNLSLAPAAQPGDSVLDLVYLEAGARADMLSWLEASGRGAPPLKAQRGRAVSFQWRRGGLHVDDAFPKLPAGPCAVEVELSPPPMTVVMPANAWLRAQIEDTR
jgi:diacylglycerol kinase (ATP)